MKDIFGKALLDYQLGDYSEDIRTETNISEEDVLPTPYLFRNYSEMPLIEKRALDLSIGKILDVGCGAGSHTLYLEEKGKDVKAIDTSEGAIKVCKFRGVKKAFCKDILHIKDEKYDTILLLMNGTGIFQKLDMVGRHLKHLKSLLTTSGQIFIDSSDLRYMYPEGEEEESIMIPSELNYYGELLYTIHYKEWTSDPFPMLYLDERIFKNLCKENRLKFEVVQRGENYDYLARITFEEYTRS